MYRFTETNKWDDEWFFELKMGHKLVWFYMLDKCDNAGFYEMPMRKACFEIGVNEEQYQGALKGLGRGLEGSNCGKYFWIKNFLKHQKNFPLNPDNKAHQQIIRILESNKSKFEDLEKNQGAFKGLLSPTGIGKVKVKVKDKVQVIDEKMILIGSLLKRKPETKWSEKEVKAYKAIGEISESDLDLMTKRYNSDDPYLRTSLLTLLNNWNGELDKARNQKNGSSTNQPKEIINYV